MAVKSPWLIAFGVVSVVHLVLNAADVTPWDSITKCFIAPLLGLYQTRAGHGVEAAKAILDLYDRVDRAESDESDRAKYLEIKVYDTLVNTSVDRTCAQRPDRFAFPATLAEISMSWWLSQPVQEFLNIQLCHERNLASLEELRTTLKKTHKKNHRPEGPAPATTQKQVEAIPETASAGSQP